MIRSDANMSTDWRSGLTAWEILESAIRDKDHPGEPGDLALAEEAYAMGVDLNARDKYGATLLIYAACENDVAMIDWLLARGAHLDGREVLEATRFEAAEALAALLKYGASPEVDEHGHRPLHLAARAGSARLAEILLEHGAKVDARDDSGATCAELLAAAGIPITKSRAPT